MKFSLRNLFLVTSFTLSATWITEISCYFAKDVSVNPCKLAKQRKMSAKYPVMRVIDETNEEAADVLLGNGRGLLGTLILQKSLQKNVVVECCSSSGPVEWTYEGKGASSGLKVASTVWASSSRSLKIGCYSAALVIINVTDQLTGKYSCKNPRSPESSHSFMLYVPYQHPFYHSEGETVNVSVSNWSDSAIPDPVVIPCISKHRSRAGISLYILKGNEEVKLNLGPHLKYDPFVGFELVPSMLYFQDSQLVKLKCKFNNNLSTHGDIANTTLLNVNLILQSDEKLTPLKSPVQSSSPYFSWTTKYNPRVNYTILYPNSSSEEDVHGSPHAIYWQQFFTKNDYEEYSTSAPRYHLGSLHLLNLQEGLTGTVELHENETKVFSHKWSFEILNNIDEHLSGLTYEVIDGLHIFTCISATKNFPSIKVKNMTTDEIDYSAGNDTSGFVVEKCPQDSVLGCLILTTMIPIGEVNCIGDGVDRTIRFPIQPFDPSPPFFVERGQSIEAVMDKDILTTNIPCPTNSPYAEFKIYLFKKERELWRSIWPVLNETSEDTVQFRPDLGFSIDENPIEVGGSGLYLCTSSPDPEDRSDAVLVNVLPFSSTNNTTDFIRTKDNSTSGLKIEKQLEDGTVSGIQMTCKSSSYRPPLLRYYLCPNSNTCELIRACSKKNCNSELKYGDSVGDMGNSSCLESQGCTSIRLKSLPLNGFLKVICTGDGINEEQSLSDVFFREDIHWSTDSDKDLIHLYVNMIASTDQNPQREVQTIGSNMDWQIGASITFSCIAAPHQFSSGIKWAIETKDGSLKYQKDNVFEDPQFKYSGPTQILSTFTLIVDSFEIQRIWCFVPTLNSPVEWRNISQPIFIRPEVDENCHETEPTIRLLNVYPPLSRIDLNLSHPRIDNLPYFVVPHGVKQFAVKLTSPEAAEWTFTGFGSGPSLTPLIESKRKITDFYDTSSYCYTSKLLVNLRQRNSNDTGRYTARFKHHSETTLSFYLFVTGGANKPHLLRSGAEVNETLSDSATPFVLPCLVDDPKITVQLFRKDEASNEYEEVEVDDESISYDPTVGFTFSTNGNDNEYLIGSYKCVANSSETDYLLVNVVARPEKAGELKFEKVGELSIFTCLSTSSNPPVIKFNEESNSSNIEDMDSKGTYKTKKCPGGCILLMTSAANGKVHCIGDGVNETMSLPSYLQESVHDDERKTGLWFDGEKNVFVCQTNSDASPKLVAVTCRRPSECKIMQNSIKQDGDTSQSTYTPCGPGCAQLKVRNSVQSDWPPNWFNIFIRCKGDDNVEIFSQYFYDKNETIPVSKSTAEHFKTIRMDVVNFRKEGTSMHVTFRCFANRYFYSKGIRWALEKQNGAFVHQDAFREVEVQNFSSIMSEAILDFDAKKFRTVYCFVPLSDSSKWTNASISFPIERLITPFDSVSII